MKSAKKSEAAAAKGLSRFFGAHGYTCVCCGADVFDETGVCGYCLPKLKFNNGNVCRRCGAALGDVDNRFCAACERFDGVFFDGAASAFVYTGEVSRLLLKMKYGGAKYLSEFFARQMANKFLTLSVGFDVAVPVPMTKSAKKKRGYNQAELLTADFCDIIGADFRFDLIEKGARDSAAGNARFQGAEGKSPRRLQSKTGRRRLRQKDFAHRRRKNHRRDNQYVRKSS